MPPVTRASSNSWSKAIPCWCGLLAPTATSVGDWLATTALLIGDSGAAATVLRLSPVVAVALVFPAPVVTVLGATGEEGPSSPPHPADTKMTRVNVGSMFRWYVFLCTLDYLEVMWMPMLRSSEDHIEK